MCLFDETALFDEGKKRYVDFQVPHTELKLWEQFFSKEESDHYYKTLLSTTPWTQRTRVMYDRILPDPRLTAYYGGDNGLPWTDLLLEIKAAVEAASSVSFNRVLLNYYRDGNDSVAWHSDQLPSDGRHHHIGSVSFGETRVFKVRPIGSRHGQFDIPLTHGSFLLMGETMQNHYEHHIPKTSRKIGGRINLTFRISDLRHKVSREGAKD